MNALGIIRREWAIVCVNSELVQKGFGRGGGGVKKVANDEKSSTVDLGKVSH